MKKIFLTLIVSIALCGSSYAQHTTHWPDFDLYEYEQHGSVVANVYIDNSVVSPNDNWSDLEVGAFVNGVMRGHMFMNYYPNDDPNPIVEIEIYYNSTGEAITFTVFDHNIGSEYEVNTGSINPETGVNLRTGEDYMDYVNPLGIYVETPSFTIDIAGYGTGTGKWFLLASPLVSDVSVEEVGDMETENFDLYRFNQATADDEWENWKTENSNHYQFVLESGRGYLYARKYDGTLTFTGLPYKGNGELSLAKTSGKPFEGWNLVGNPYSTPATVAKSFYVMNEGGTGLIAATTNVVGAMEGLMVYAETDGEVVTFTEGASKADAEGQIVMNLYGGSSVIDRVIVRFGENVTLPKYTLDNSTARVYVKDNGDRYAVVRGESSGEVAISFTVPEAGQYTFNANAEKADVSYLHLIDKLTGDDVDMLAEGKYTFVGSPVDNSERFVLKYTCNGAMPGGGVFAYQSGSDIVVIGTGELQVYDVMGRLVSTHNVNGVETIAKPSQNGVYIFRMNENTQKIVVR